MGEDERRTQLPGDSDTGLDGPWFPFQQLCEIYAIHVLHHEVVNVQLLAEIVDRHDVRMIQAGQDLRLTLEARGETRLNTDLFGQHFHCDEAIEPFLVCLVNGAHASASDHIKPLELGQQLAELRQRILIVIRRGQLGSSGPGAFRVEIC